jgi:hypothetical protein
VIVTPNSTVRTIVSAMTETGKDVGCDTGFPRLTNNGVGTLIISRRGPISAQRHDPYRPGHHVLTCTPFPVEPVLRSDQVAYGSTTRRRISHGAAYDRALPNPLPTILICRAAAASSAKLDITGQPI